MRYLYVSWVLFIYLNRACWECSRSAELVFGEHGSMCTFPMLHLCGQGRVQVPLTAVLKHIKQQFSRLLSKKAFGHVAIECGSSPSKLYETHPNLFAESAPHARPCSRDEYFTAHGSHHKYTGRLVHHTLLLFVLHCFFTFLIVNFSVLQKPLSVEAETASTRSNIEPARKSWAWPPIFRKSAETSAKKTMSSQLNSCILMADI